MRELKFNEPVKIRETRLRIEHQANPESMHFERCTCVFSKKGIVVVEDYIWDTNFGKDRFAVFSTIINGLKYSATLEEGKLSERQIKWLATNFMNQLYKKFNPNNQQK